MINQIINFSIKNKLIVILFTVTISAYGVYSVFNIPVGAVPDITNNQVQVITVSPNLSTQDVEQFITYPVELEMSNLPGVKEIRSISKFGLSVVTIVFDDNMGTYLPRPAHCRKDQIGTSQYSRRIRHSRNGTHHYRTRRDLSVHPGCKTGI